MKIKLLIALASLLGSVILSGVLSAAPIAITPVKHDGDVDFEKEILPILRKKCLACHNGTVAESDLVMETPQSILKGGSEGPAIVPGKSAESLLMKVGTQTAKPAMPPEKNDVGAKPLTGEELGLIQLWIDQGAKGQVIGKLAPIVWQPLPPGVHPIYALGVAPTGEYAAVGRANQVSLYHLPSRREIGRLTDPEIIKSGIYKQPGIADLDLIQSIAFSQDGNLLATGGYRTLKIWRRPRNVHLLDLPALAAAARSSAASADGKWLAFGDEAGAIHLLNAADGKLVKSLAGHTGAVTSLEFTTDSAQLYSGSVDKTVRTWNVAEQKETFKLDTPDEVHVLRLVAKGTKLATGGPDKIVRLWNVPLAAGEPVHKLAGLNGAVVGLAALGDAQVASLAADGGGSIFDVGNGNKVKDFSHGGPATGLVARADGKRMVTAGANNIAKLHNLENNQAVEMRGDLNAKYKAEELQRALALSKKHIELAKKDLDEATKRKTSEEDNAKKATEAVTKAEAEAKAKTDAAKKPTEDKEAADKALADAMTGQTAAIAAKKAADEAQPKAAATLTTVTKQRDDATAAATAATSALKSANDKLAAAKKAAEADAGNAGLAEAVKAVEKEVADADAKNKAATDAKAAQDKAFADADAAKKAADQAKQLADQAATKATNDVNQAMQKVQQVKAPYQKAIDEKTAATRNHEAAVRSVERSMTAVKAATEAIPMFDAAVKAAETKSAAADEASKAAVAAVPLAEKPYKTLALSPDGLTIAIAGDAMIVYTFDTNNGAAVDAFTGHATAVTSLVYTSTGNIVSAAADQSAIVWNATAEWKLERTIGSPNGESPIVDRVTAIDFSPDGTLVATGSGEPSRSGELKIWKVADGTLALEFKEPHSDTIYDVEFSPSGQHIASCGADRFMKVFDLNTKKLHRSYEGHTHHVLGVSWRADGRLLASSGADNVVKIWNFQTGDQLRTIQGFGKEVTALKFAGDGDSVAASSGDKTVRIKNAENGNDMRSLSGATDYLYAVGASADGKTIVAGGADGVVLMWTDQTQPAATFAPK